jgi:hypothetical protein
MAAKKAIRYGFTRMNADKARVLLQRIVLMRGHSCKGLSSRASFLREGSGDAVPSGILVAVAELCHPPASHETATSMDRERPWPDSSLRSE